MKIIKTYIYSLPNIISFNRAARVVLFSSQDFLKNFDQSHKEQIRTLANRYLDDVLGETRKYFPIPDFMNIETLPDLFLQMVFYFQGITRHPVEYKGQWQNLENGFFEVSFNIYKEEGLDKLLDTALNFTLDVVLDKPISDDEFQRYYQNLQGRSMFGLSSLFINDRITTAKYQAVPVQIESGRRVYIGQGIHRQLIAGGYKTSTSRLGKAIAGDKERTAGLLAQGGLPVPMQVAAFDSKSAVKAAQEIGFPVVVKPRSGNKGRAVSVNLKTPEEVEKAYIYSKELMHSNTVVVEQYIEGEDHRLLVIDNQLVGVVKRIAAHIIGDGKHSIRELMEITNKHERRDKLYLYPLISDNEVERILKEQGYHLEAIPAKGEHVLLRGAANVSLGGTTRDFTDQVHQDNIEMAIEAAKIAFLDVAGIDFVTSDISKSWRDGYGGIVEINSGPGVDLHMCPTQGTPRNISKSMIRSVFPKIKQSRIPVVLVTGNFSKRNVACSVSSLLSLTGYSVGTALRNDLSVTGQALDRKNKNTSPYSLLTDHRINAAVFEIPMLELAQTGSPSDQTAVTILTDAHISDKLAEKTNDKHMGERIIKFASNLATHAVVADGNNRRLRKIIAHIPAEQLNLVWPAENSNSSFIKKHLNQGGKFFIVQEFKSMHWVMLLYKNKQYPLVNITQFFNKSASELFSGSFRKTLRELLLSIAAFHSINSSIIQLREALQLFSPLFNHLTTLLYQVNLRSKVKTACLDPRDSRSVDVVKKSLGLLKKQNRLFIVLSENENKTEQSHLNQIIHQLDSEQTFWFFTSEDRTTLLSIPSNSNKNHFAYPNTYQAWQAAHNQATHGDMVLLLSGNRNERYQTMALSSPSFVKLIKTHVNPDYLWESQSLAAIFNGEWVYGQANNWGINRVNLGGEAVSKGDLVIIPDQPKYQDSSAQLVTENKIDAAFKSGALAVISTIAPIETARHHFFMICQDPMLGLEKLAIKSRRRLKSSVLCFLGDSSKLLESFTSAFKVNSGNKNRVAPYFYQIKSPSDNNFSHEKHAEFLVSVANIPATSHLVIYLLNEPSPYLLNILQPSYCVFSKHDTQINQQLNQLKSRYRFINALNAQEVFEKLKEAPVD